VEVERLARFLALQRDEYQSDPTSASLLIESMAGDAPVASADLKQAPELAAWTSVARVLFNLDDFVTRE
jgi:hypothetical protein